MVICPRSGHRSRRRTAASAAGRHARRHAVHSRRRDACSRLHLHAVTRSDRRRRQQLSTRRSSTSRAATSTSPATSRTSSPSASRPTSRRRRPVPAAASQRQPDVPREVRLRPVQPRRLDDEGHRGSRFGIQQTPWVDFEEGIYRYRFQGTVFAEREGYRVARRTPARRSTTTCRRTTATFTSASTTARTTTGRKSTIRRRFEFRGTLRPFAKGSPVLRGIRVHGVLRRRQLRAGRRAQARPWAASPSSTRT